MSEMKKVIWAEGMMMTQQHFQLWDKFTHQQQILRERSLHPEGFGVAQIDIDEKALQAQEFHLNYCEAIMANGEYVQYKNSHGERINLHECTSDQISIYLALPCYGGVTDLTGYDTVSLPCRWRGEYEYFKDENDECREAEILIGHQNTCILSSEQASEQFHILEIARLICFQQQWQLCNNYIPAVLRISAANNLVTKLMELVNQLHSKINRLLEKVKGTRHYIHRTCIINKLMHHAAIFGCDIRHGAGHPERVYRLLLALVADLGIYDLELFNNFQGKYIHCDLTTCFNSILQLAHILIEKVDMLGDCSVPLSRLDKTTLVAKHINDDALKSKAIYIGICVEQSDMTIENLLKNMMVSSYQRLPKVVSAAIPGARIEKVQFVPEEITIKPGFSYFYVHPSSEDWHAIVNERSIAIHLGDDAEKIKIDVFTVYR